MTEREDVISIIGQEAFDNLIENDEMSEETYEKLFSEYYVDHEDMPYGTKKARTGDPHQWICKRLHWLVKHDVISSGNMV